MPSKRHSLQFPGPWEWAHVTTTATTITAEFPLIQLIVSITISYHYQIIFITSKGHTPGSMFRSSICTLFRVARRQQWPRGATLPEQLRGHMEDLVNTTAFVRSTGLRQHRMRQNHARARKKTTTLITVLLN